MTLVLNRCYGYHWSVCVLSYAPIVMNRGICYEGTFEDHDVFQLCELRDMYECYDF